VPPPGLAAAAGRGVERRRTITPLPAAPDALATVSERDSAPAISVPPPVPPPRDVVDPAVVARGSTPAFEPDVKAAVDTPTFTADGVQKKNFDGDALPLPPLDASSPRLAASSRKSARWWLLGGALGVVAAAAALIIVMTMSSSNGDSAPTKSKRVAELAPVQPKPDPATDVSPAADEPEESHSDGPPVVGEGPCKLVVASTPAGSIIAVDGKNVGPSPLTIATTCEQHKVDIAHARYQGTSKVVTLTEDKPGNLDVTLQRPTHIVTVTSNPAGATIYIDGRSAGTTPTKLSVLGFVTVKLELKKTGYQSATTKLYSRYPQDNVAVRLTKW
jgi:hypothetical protein